MSGIEGYIYVAIEGRGNIKVSADGPDSKVHRANMGPTWGGGAPGGAGWAGIVRSVSDPLHYHRSYM